MTILEFDRLGIKGGVGFAAGGARVANQPTELGLGFPQFGRPKLQKILYRDTGHRILPKILINREEASMLQL
jgi:hypothetical protein